MSEIKQTGNVSGQQQQAPQQPTLIQQQQVEGQTIQVQISHNGPDQMHSQNPQAMNLQNQPTLAPMPSQGATTTLTTMSAGPAQQMADWAGHGRVQVIQQPIQNPTYIQPVYNAQGQLIVPGNIALHPGNMNQPIQVIAAGKPFQAGQMPHMLATAQGKPLVQGQTTSFPGYATIPTSGNNQTLVISQLGVLGQTNILPQQQGKPAEMQKMLAKTNVSNNNIKQTTNQQQNVSISNLVSSQTQGITTQAQTIIQPQIISPIQYTCNTQQQRAVPQGTTQAMQFAPWQATFGPTGLPQGLTWTPGAIQSSALLTQGSQIFIRNPQHEQTGMFIHNAQPSTIPQQQQQQHNQMTSQPINKPNQAIELGGNIQNKAPIAKTFSTILPNSVGPQNIRPASSVSTQTGQTQTPMHQASFQSFKVGSKVRTKNVCRMPSMATTQKSDAANQTRTSTSQIIQARVANNPNLPNTSHNQNISPDKTIRQNRSQQQPLIHIQNMQNMFQDQNDQKNQNGQITVSSGKPGLGDSGMMPIVSLAPGQLSPLVVNMVVQTVPGISSSTSGISLVSNQQVQGVQNAQEIIQGPASLTLPATIKQEAPNKRMSVQENRESETETERPGDSSTNLAADVTYSESALSVEEKADKIELSTSKERISDNRQNDCEMEEKDDKEEPESPHTPTKATVVVKPQVLTHLIEGFIIQESSEPFPVRGSMDGAHRRMPDFFGEPLSKRPCLASARTEPTRTEQAQTEQAREQVRVEQCRAEQDKTHGERSRQEVSQATQNNDSNVCNVAAESNETHDNNVNNVDSGETFNNPQRWSVAQVCDFIRNLPGCSGYVDEFAVQEIDGESLLLLKPEHLTTAMSIKLGPAVKIISKIDKIRPPKEGSENPQKKESGSSKPGNETPREPPIELPNELESELPDEAMWQPPAEPLSDAPAEPLSETPVEPPSEVLPEPLNEIQTGQPCEPRLRYPTLGDLSRRKRGRPRKYDYSNF